MTDKRILIETPHQRISDHINTIFDKNHQAIFYTKDYLKITEIDLDDGTVRNIPITPNKKIIFTQRKGTDYFDYEFKEEEEEEEDNDR